LFDALGAGGYEVEHFAAELFGITLGYGARLLRWMS
jgi:hypothetical protein